VIAALSKRCSKARRELKNLESLINYDAFGRCSSCGKGNVRACPVFLSSQGFFPGM
jgi:hypothetical protein